MTVFYLSPEMDSVFFAVYVFQLIEVDPFCFYGKLSEELLLACVVVEVF